MASELVEKWFRRLHGDWPDVYSSHADARAFIAGVEREAKLAGALEMAAEVCAYCGARAFPDRPEAHVVHGPNAAGNYTHETVGGRHRLCSASAIHAFARRYGQEEQP